MRTGKLLIGILSFIAILCLGYAPVVASSDSARPNQTVPPTPTVTPSVIGVLPNQAYNHQPTTVTISGSGFVATPTVWLNNVPLLSITFVNSATLTATVPADLPGGAYTLTVTNPDSQSASLASAFTVLMSGDGSLGSWQATNPMTTQRVYFNAVAVRGSLYALGGVAGSLPLNTVERAVINTDGTLQTWQMVNSMITGREAPATVATGNYIYTLGGNDNSVERVIVNSDGTLGTWEAMNSMPTTRNYVAAVVTQGYLYALGGDSGGPLDIVERAVINADGSLGAWQAANPMTTKRRSLAAVVVGGFIYALGGNDFSGALNSIERAAINADGTLGEWQVARTMRARRAHFAAMATGGYLFALGGQGGGVLNNVERAAINTDGSLGAWQELTPMITKRRGLAAIVSEGYIYALGGNDDFSWLNSVERTTINWPLLSLFTSSAVRSDQPTTITVNGTNILPTPTLRLGDSTTLTSSFVSTTTVSATIPSGLASGWYTATLTSGDGRITTLSNALRVDGPGTVLVGDYGLSINDGALFTNQVTVTLSIFSRPDTAQMQTSNDGGFAGVQWETYASHKTWQITQYGSYVIPRVVYIRYKDLNGNVSATSSDDTSST